MGFKLFFSVFLFVFTSRIVSSQPTVESIILQTKTGEIKGTLSIPESEGRVPLVLIIAGSGPTDRNGNNPVMTNNSLKMLAEGLSDKGVATIRYDKRGVAESRGAGVKEIDLRFEHYVDDVRDWIGFLSQDERFSEIIILGHSEGSLIGMIAAQQENVSAFISLAGVGVPAGEIIREQLKTQPPIVLEQSLPIIEKIEQGDTVNNIPPMLWALFRPSVQPYMISWFKYNPQLEIAKLEIPILIIQGNTDIQVSLSDAEKLASANKLAEKHIIEGMNHILKEADRERQKNIATYSQPNLPLKKELTETIATFISNH